MAEETKQQSWYQTLPGILTALGSAALGIGTLLAGIHAYTSSAPNQQQPDATRPTATGNAAQLAAATGAMAQSPSNPANGLSDAWRGWIYVERSDDPESQLIAQGMEQRLCSKGFKVASAKDNAQVDLSISVHTELSDQPNLLGDPNYTTSLALNAKEEPRDKPLPLSVSFTHIDPEPDARTAEGHALDRAVAFFS